MSHTIESETNLVEIEAEIGELRADQDRRREFAQNLLAEAGEREAAAQKFLDDNASLLPYRLAACAVGDDRWTPEAVEAFRQELDVARKTIEEASLLQNGLVELIQNDWNMNSALSRAIHRRDAARRREKLSAEGRLVS